VLPDRARRPSSVASGASRDSASATYQASQVLMVSRSPHTAQRTAHRKTGRSEASEGHHAQATPNRRICLQQELAGAARGLLRRAAGEAQRVSQTPTFGQPKSRRLPCRRGREQRLKHRQQASPTAGGGASWPAACSRRWPCALESKREGPRGRAAWRVGSTGSAGTPAALGALAPRARRACHREHRERY
jgi:hypothetical protein